MHAIHRTATASAVTLALSLLMTGLVAPVAWAQQPSPPLPPGYVLVDDMVLPVDALHGDSNYIATPWLASAVFYQFSAAISTARRDLFRTALAEIEATSFVRFYESTGVGNYISVINNSFSSNVSYSSVGMVGGAQDLAVGSNHWDNKYILVHELFHALGYLHEQSRPDRDTYVTINWSNISQTGCSGNPCDGNFQTANSTVVGSYDFLSIMHYGQFGFAVNPSIPTILCKPAYSQYQSQIGNRTYMTVKDANGLQARYGNRVQPTVSSVSPTSVSAGSGNITITVTGAHFLEGSPNSSGIQGTRVRFDFLELETTFIDRNTVTAVVPASKLTSPGTFNVDVVQDFEAGSNSPASVNFTVNYPPCSSNFDEAGYDVAGLGDVNGDGKDDFAVGAPGYGSNQGRVTVYSGATGATLFAVNGPSSSSRYGRAIAALNDVTGDGRKDLLIGAPSYNSGAGRFEIRSGATGGLHSVVSYGSVVNFGWSVAGAGDVDGDGDQDFLVGAPAYNSAAGRVELWSSNGGLMRSHNGTAAGDQFGWAVGGGYDVNSDGSPDYVVGAPFKAAGGGSASGRAYIISGATGSTLVFKDGDGVADYFGYDVAIVPSSSGYSTNGQIIVGAPDYGDLFGGNAGPGYARLFRGFSLLNSYGTIYTFNGNANGDRFGHKVGTAGDFNDDGSSDFLVCAPMGGVGASGATGNGFVDLFSGVDGTLAHHERRTYFLNPPNGISFGWSAAFAGDLDGDARNDYVVGVPFSDTPCPNSGDFDTFNAPVPPALGRVLITEVNAGSPDCVELTNFGTTTVSLNNLVLKWKDGATIYTSSPLGVSILPGQIIVFQEPGSPPTEMPGNTTNVVAFPSIGTTLNDYAVALIMPNGQVVDEVHVASSDGTYANGSLGGKFRGYARNLQDGPIFGAIAVERIWGLDSNSGGDWVSHGLRSMGLENAGAGTRGYDPVPVKRVHLNEIDDSPDYVEIVNLSGANIDMRNWYLLTSANQNSVHTVNRPDFANGLLFGLLANNAYCVLGDTATAPAEKPTLVQYVDVTANAQPGFPFITEELECALYDNYGHLVDLVRSTGHDDNVAHNHPRAPSRWSDFMGAANRDVPGTVAFGRNPSSVDFNLGTDWTAEVTRTMGTANTTPSALPPFDSKMNVVLNATGMGGGLTMIINAGDNAAGQLWTFGFSYGHLNGNGPILGLGADALANYQLFSTTPPWFGYLDSRGSARLDVPPNTISPGSIQTDDIFLLQDATSLNFVDLTFILQFDI